MGMATLLLMFLVTHSSGTQDILSVSKISVEKHQTIIIPCLYDQKYVRNHKYVSSGGSWFFASKVTHDRMSVVDNQTEKVFTATLRNAEESDSGTYWCGISVPGYDPNAKLYLEVGKGKARLHISSQSVSGYEGGKVAAVCHGASQWCQIGGSCVGGINGGTSDKTEVHISGDGDALIVTLSELKREDSGWYYCSDGESQMPVYITVRKAPRPVTVQHTTYTIVKFSQDMSVGLSVLWLVILGAVLPVIVCTAVILIRVIYRRKHRAEASHPSEGMDSQPLCKGSGTNNEATCENLYEKTGIKQNILGNEKHEEVTCDSLYEIMTGITQNFQGNEKFNEVENLYEKTGITQNILGNEKNEEVENLYEIMTGIKQNIQLPAMENTNIYECMVRKIQ